MSNGKDSREVKQNTLRFLESLSNDRLLRLINSTTFMEDVFRYATQSAVLTLKIEEIFKSEYQNLSPQEHKDVGVVAQRLTEKFHAMGLDNAVLTAPDESRGRLDSVLQKEISKRLSPVFRPGDVLRFKGVSNARNVKAFHVRLRKDPEISQRVPVIWSKELPAAASSASALLPELETATLGDMVFQLEEGSIDLNSHETTLRLKLLEGPRYPIPELEVFLITEDGRVIPSEEKSE